MSDNKEIRRNASTTVVVVFVLAVIICTELLIHLIPLHGAIQNDLNDYNTYPVMMVSLSDIKDHADIDDHSATYRIEWDKGNLFQNAVVQVTFYNGEISVSALSSEQIDVRCNGLFFKQTGDSVNIVDDIIYIQVSGYRKTLFFSSGAEPFGFALKIMND